MNVENLILDKFLDRFIYQNKESKMNVITYYQLYNQDGDPVLERFHYLESAQYMVNNYFQDYTIVEIEEILNGSSQD